MPEGALRFYDEADRIGRRIDHGHTVGVEVTDIDFAAVRGDGHAEGLVADENRRDHCVRRRVDHRHSAVAAIRNVGVFGERGRSGKPVLARPSLRETAA